MLNNAAWRLDGERGLGDAKLPNILPGQSALRHLRERVWARRVYHNFVVPSRRLKLELAKLWCEFSGADVADGQATLIRTLLKSVV